MPMDRCYLFLQKYHFSLVQNRRKFISLFFKFIFSSCYITRLSKCCKRIDIKKKQEKTVTVAKGFHLLTNIFERLVPPHFTIIILMTQAVCGT